MSQIQQSVNQAREALRALLDDDRFADDAREAIAILNGIEDKARFYDRLNDVSSQVAESPADVIANRLNAVMHSSNIAFAPALAAGLDESGLDLGCIEDMGAFLEAFGFVVGTWTGIFVDECRRRFPAPPNKAALLTEQGFDSLIRFIKETEKGGDDQPCDVQFEYDAGEENEMYSPWQASTEFNLQDLGCKVRAYFFVVTPHDFDGDMLPPERTVRIFIVKGEKPANAVVEHVCDVCSDTRPGKLFAVMPGVIALVRETAKFINKGA